MKQLLVIIALVAISCSEKPKQPPKEQRTLVMYPFNGNANDWRIGAAWKITVDSIAPDSANPTRNKRQDFTYYNVAVTYKMFDTTGRPLMDTLGRQKDTTQWLPMSEKSIIVDYKKDWAEYVPQGRGGKK